ncbi:MAG: cyclic nucleotide-binding domain-containing protein [Desulfobacteraceae bacterium]|jgi:CRP-like cAMP-binding protein
MGKKKKIPPIISLRFKKGDLIFKQGDYGISMYKIIQGKVLVFRESGEREVILATLGPGEIIGEMTFLSGPNVPRSASAKAVEGSKLEVWHFSRLRREYEEMPPILKVMATQTLERLVRTNNTLVKLDAKQSGAEGPEKAKRGATQRRFYRKEVNLDCTYRPTKAAPNARLRGRIRDIGLGGVRLEVTAKNGGKSYYKPGEVFIINTALPNGKELEVMATVAAVGENGAPGRLSLGMCFTNTPTWVKERLGFFLMS